MSNLLDVDQILLSQIHYSLLIPSLTSFDQYPTLRTVAGPDISRSLFIEREDNPLLYQDPNHNQNLDSIWNFS